MQYTFHKPTFNISAYSKTEKQFLSIAKTKFDKYANDLLLKINDVSNRLIDPEELINIYIKLISPKLIHLISRPAVLELNIAREMNILQGDSPNQRFNYFFQQLNHDAFFKQYPVLNRLINTTFLNLNDYLHEILMSYKQEWEEIFPESPCAPKIIKIEMDLMDCYPKGRAVAIIHFSNQKKWVFKPRDSALDAAFQKFLGWFNSKNILKPFKLINIIVKKNHSWSEFVEYSYIEGNDELLFQKYGALLCFFYLFNSTDMHQRNLIISGDTPILIDLETLVQPYNNNNFSWSLFRTNFLPTRPMLYQPDADDIDYALQKGYEQDNKVWSKQKKICWENEGMDNMKIFQRRQLVEPHKWQMGAVKHNMNSLAQVNQVIDAFRKTYLFIIENKNEFLHVITCFKSLKSRIIIRSTKKYDALLNEMSHPLILESQTALDEFLKPLEYESDYSDNAFKIIEEEKKKLNEMTSPSFYALTDSSELYTFDNMLIDDYFDNCAMTLISKNVSEMSKENLKKLIRIIKRHFSYLNYT